jgi:hypothetical protein
MNELIRKEAARLKRSAPLKPVAPEIPVDGQRSTPEPDSVEPLITLLREGVQILNSIPHDQHLSEESLPERAVNAWSHKARDALSTNHPEWALHFDKPIGRFVKLRYSSGALRADFHSRLQRLSQIIQVLRGAGSEQP